MLRLPNSIHPKSNLYKIPLTHTEIRDMSVQEILQAAVYSPRDLNLLKPQSPELLLDAEYCLSAMGLLAQKFPETALKMMNDKIRKVTTHDPKK